MNPKTAKTLRLKNSALWIVAILLLVLNNLMSEGPSGVLLAIAVPSFFVLMLSSNAMMSGAASEASSANGSAATDPIA